MALKKETALERVNTLADGTEFSFSLEMFKENEKGNQIFLVGEKEVSVKFDLLRLDFVTAKAISQDFANCKTIEDLLGKKCKVSYVEANVPAFEKDAQGEFVRKSNGKAIIAGTEKSSVMKFSLLT